MAKPNSIIIKSFRIPAENFKIIKEVSDELCISQIDIVRLLLQRALMQLKHDAIRMGGYKNLDFAIKKVK